MDDAFSVNLFQCEPLSFGQTLETCSEKFSLRIWDRQKEFQRDTPTEPNNADDTKLEAPDSGVQSSHRLPACSEQDDLFSRK